MKTAATGILPNDLVCIYRERGSTSARMCQITGHLAYLDIVRYTTDVPNEQHSQINAFDLVPVENIGPLRLARLFLNDILHNDRIHHNLRKHGVAPNFNVVLHGNPTIVLKPAGKGSAKWLCEIDGRVVTQTPEHDYCLAGDELLKQLDNRIEAVGRDT